MPAVAGVAQLVEQWFCKPQVGGSNPSVGTEYPSRAAWGTVTVMYCSPPQAGRFLGTGGSYLSMAGTL